MLFKCILKYISKRRSADGGILDFSPAKLGVLYSREFLTLLHTEPLETHSSCWTPPDNTLVEPSILRILKLFEKLILHFFAMHLDFLPLSIAILRLGKSVSAC